MLCDLLPKRPDLPDLRACAGVRPGTGDVGQMTDSSVIFGFDSAWTDNPRAPGAICALIRDPGAPPRFVAPQLAGFDAALSFIDSHRAGRRSLVALDQPTVVPNLAGSRPADKVAASVVIFPA